MIGHAHLDPVYMWRWQEGFQEIRATYRSALDRMKEFPELIFAGSSAAFYEWIEEIDPGMFAEIRARVAEGRWVPVGGWWVESDCNVPGGESFARHGLYAQRYFQEKLGARATVGFSPDSFGHPGSLPQLLRLAGMRHYIFMRPDAHDAPAVPTGPFQWSGIDGSEVTAYHILPASGYGSRGYQGSENMQMEKGLPEARDVIGRGFPSAMLLFGISNHGGGPTIRQLQRIRALQAAGSDPRPQCSSPAAYFQELEESGASLPLWAGDIGPFAVGCYTAHSQVKLLVQRAEALLVAAEKACFVASQAVGLAYPLAELNRAWKDVLFSQFHDILAGTSIAPAYEDVRDQLGRAMRAAAEAANNARQSVAARIDTRGAGVPLIVFNPHAQSLRAAVELELDVCDKPEEWGIRLVDETGREVPIQLHTTRVVFWPGIRLAASFITDLPPLGWRTFRIVARKPQEGEREMPVRHWQPRQTPPSPAAPTAPAPRAVSPGLPVLEGEHLRLEVDPNTGAISSLVDRRLGVELLRSPGILPIVLDDPTNTWSMGHRGYDDVCGAFGDADVKVAEAGPVRSTLVVRQRFGRSTMTQRIVLYRELPWVQIEVTVCWQEQRQALKLSIPTTVRGTLRAEEPYGSVERPLRAGEQPFQRWLDLSGDVGSKAAGLGLILEGKHGYDARDGEIRVTLLRSPPFCCAVDTLDPREEYEYMDQGVQAFAYLLVPHAGDWRAAGYTSLADRLLLPPVTVVEHVHEGQLPAASTGFEVFGDGIGIGAIKLAEEGSDWIVRCFEHAGTPAAGVLRAPLLGRDIPVQLSPFQVLTLRVPVDPSLPVTRVNFLEEEVSRS
jgi:alpha-mannosidase